jgi:hypothetical protein
MTSKAIHQLTDDEKEQVFAWARYVYWADVECQQYDAHEQVDDEPTTGLTFVLMLKWYASLYVAIEGWAPCPLLDDTVDELLTDSAFTRNLDLLRRFRNGVYHYQPDLISDKLLGFLREANQTVTWAFLVHSEFKRVLWELAHPAGLPAEKQTELTDLLADLIGWWPDASDLPEAAPHRAERSFREAWEVISRDQAHDTPRGKELMQAVRDLQSAANQAADGWAKQKRAMIESLKQRKPISFPDGQAS